MAIVQYPHIAFGPGDVPILAGTQTKVVEIVLDQLAHGWDGQEIQRQHPHLTLAQIYSALAYYHDHQAEIDQDIEKRLESVEKIKLEVGESSIRLKLKALGRLP